MCVCMRTYVTKANNGEQGMEYAFVNNNNNSKKI